jgi:hypothetical protein
VTRDAKNRCKYVPYAIVAYRAAPHCAVKYSPYYLVFGRGLRFPIEDDWNPRIQSRATNEVDYEKHVQQLAERLREAYRIAGRHSSRAMRWLGSIMSDDPRNYYMKKES